MGYGYILQRSIGFHYRVDWGLLFLIFNVIILKLYFFLVIFCLNLSLLPSLSFSFISLSLSLFLFLLFFLLSLSLSLRIFRRRSKRLRFDLRKMDLSDPEQLRQLKEIGISVSTSGDGKVMMTHNPHLVCVQ